MSGRGAPVPDDASPARPPVAPPRRRAYHWLALLPAAGFLIGTPLVNRVEPYVLGLPLILFWIVAWVVGTAVVMAVILRLDHERERGR